MVDVPGKGSVFVLNWFRVFYLNKYLMWILVKSKSYDQPAWDIKRRDDFQFAAGFPKNLHRMQNIKPSVYSLLWKLVAGWPFWRKRGLLSQNCLFKPTHSETWMTQKKQTIDSWIVSWELADRLETRWTAKNNLCVVILAQYGICNHTCDASACIL